MGNCDRCPRCTDADRTTRLSAPLASFGRPSVISRYLASDDFEANCPCPQIRTTTFPHPRDRVRGVFFECRARTAGHSLFVSRTDLVYLYGVLFQLCVA